MSDTDVEIDTNPIAGTVEVHNTSLPDGYEIFIPGIGVVENGTVRDVTTVQLVLFQDAGFEWPEDGKLIIQEESSGEEGTVPLQEGSEESTATFQEGSSQEDAEESDS